MLFTDKSCVQHLCPADMDTVGYYTEPDMGRMLSEMEILEMRAGEVNLPEGWNNGEIDNIFMSACCD